MDEVEAAGLSPRARRGIALISVALVGLAAGIGVYLWSVAPHPYSGPPPPPTSLAIPVSMDWHAGAMGWLVVHDGGGPESVLFRTTDGGARWVRQFAIGGPAFVRFTDARHGTLNADPTQASGARLLRSDDGGAAWRPVPPPPLAPGAATAAFFLDNDHGWLFATDAGAAARVYRTADGGRSWTPLAAVGEPAPLQGLAFGSAGTGWLFGGALLLTRDGGATWMPATLPPGPPPGDSVVVGAPAVAAGGAGVLPVSDRVTGRGWLYATEDGGASWSDPRPLPGSSDRATAFSPGAAGGWTWDDTGAWLTPDSGRTWLPASALPAGWRFSSISPVGAAEAWATAARAGAASALGPTRWALFHTTDGGRHWRRAPLPSLA
jgi:photosystem II stability/assembly factor-like uncharacterized protein